MYEYDNNEYDTKCVQYDVPMRICDEKLGLGLVLSNIHLLKTY